MKIIVVGAGKVGYSVAKILSEEGHDITVIDRNPYDYVDSDELFQMKNLRTIVGGKTVYAAE